MRMRRRVVDALAMIFAVGATAFGLLWLVWILWTTLRQGAAAISPALFTQMTPPPGASGGLLNAFYGSAVMVLLALVIGTPVGIAQNKGHRHRLAKRSAEAEEDRSDDRGASVGQGDVAENLPAS